LSLGSDWKTFQRMRLPWWGLLCLMVCALPITWLLDHSGRLALARPLLYSLVVLLVAIMVKWELRRHLWFWVTITVVAGLHVPLLVLIPWTTGWIPAIVALPVGIADLYLILTLLSFVGKLVRTWRAPMGDRKGEPTANGVSLPRR